MSTKVNLSEGFSTKQKKADCCVSFVGQNRHSTDRIDQATRIITCNDQIFDVFVFKQDLEKWRMFSKTKNEKTYRIFHNLALF